MSKYQNETLHQFMERVSGDVELIYRQLGTVEAFWHAVTADGQQLILPSIHSPLEAPGIKAVFIAHGVVRYAFIDQGKWSEPPPGVPKDQEGVMIWVEDQCEGTLLGYRPLANDRKGLGPLVKIEDIDLLAGNMVVAGGMLPPRTGTIH